MKVKVNEVTIESSNSAFTPDVEWSDSEHRDPESSQTLNINFSGARSLEIWPDGHYQFWSGDLLVEGDDILDTLFSYGSTTKNSLAMH